MYKSITSNNNCVNNGVIDDFSSRIGHYADKNEDEEDDFEDCNIDDSIVIDDILAKRSLY